MTALIYFEDGSSFFGEIPPPEMRWAGVIGIAQYDKATGRETVAHCDFYYRRAGRWYGASDIVAMVDQLVAHCEDIDCLLVGRMTDPETYNRVMRDLALDPRLGSPKTAKYQHERLKR